MAASLLHKSERLPPRGSPANQSDSLFDESKRHHPRDHPDDVLRCAKNSLGHRHGIHKNDRSHSSEDYTSAVRPGATSLSTSSCNRPSSTSTAKWDVQAADQRQDFPPGAPPNPRANDTGIGQ